jgi:hypothetical protein
MSCRRRHFSCTTARRRRRCSRRASRRAAAPRRTAPPILGEALAVAQPRRDGHHVDRRARLGELRSRPRRCGRSPRCRSARLEQLEHPIERVALRAARPRARRPRRRGREEARAPPRWAARGESLSCGTEDPPFVTALARARDLETNRKTPRGACPRSVCERSPDRAAYAVAARGAPTPRTESRGVSTPRAAITWPSRSPTRWP